MDRVHGYNIQNLPLLFGKKQKVELCSEICEAVDQFHATGHMHLDIKPANIMLDLDGAVLVDYSTALPLEERLIGDIDGLKLGEANYIKRDGTFRGTIEYVAPEQALGNPTRQSDYYALGLVVLELIDKYPFPRLTSRDSKTVEQFLTKYMLNPCIGRDIVSSLEQVPFVQSLPKVAKQNFSWAIKQLIHNNPNRREMRALREFCRDYPNITSASFITPKIEQRQTVDQPVSPTIEWPELIEAEFE